MPDVFNSYQPGFDVKKFLKDESGATAIEYVLIATAIGLLLIVVLPPLALALRPKYNSVTNGFSTFT
jgi:pilus assembly protein Flp/PilA